MFLVIIMISYTKLFVIIQGGGGSNLGSKKMNELEKFSSSTNLAR